MTNQLDLSIQGFSELEDNGLKEDGTPDIRVKRGYNIRLVRNRDYILFEETLPRESLPVDPRVALTKRITEILTVYLPQIEPE